MFVGLSSILENPQNLTPQCILKFSGKDYCNRTRAVKYFKGKLTNVVKEALEDILSHAARIDEVHIGKVSKNLTLKIWIKTATWKPQILKPYKGV